MFKNSNLRHIPVYKLIPSLITLLALCLGITSIRYAFDEKWSIAAALIFISTILDALDGRIARFLDASSRFGAELDSLSDLVSFGVAPAIVMYLWSLYEIPHKGVGWSVVLFFIVCSALRLARFNSNTTSESTDRKAAVKQQAAFFTGIPMPAGGVLAMLPLLTTFELIDNIFSYWFVAGHVIVIGLLMVSKIPTWSIKTLHIAREYVPITLVLAAVLMAAMILEPWVIIPIMALIYLCSIPLAAFYYRKR